MTNSAPASLDDLRVIELCDEKGQYAGKLLADMGADVIKVEKPGGDDARRVGPFVDDIPHPDRSLYFWHYNTNKCSITLNIEHLDGQHLLRRLVEKADILLESFAPGYLARLGLGYPELSRLNPRLIMTSITAFGQTGPYRDFKTSDLIALAMGGIMASCGYDDVPGSPPIRPGGGQGYNLGTHYATLGTLMALIFRDFTGQGQYVDTSIHEAVSGCTEAAMPTYFWTGQVVKRQTGRHHALTPTHVTQFKTTDGYYINTMGIPRSLSRHLDLVRLMKEKGIQGDLEDEKYRQLILSGVRAGPDYDHYMSLMGAFISSMTVDEAYHTGQGIEMPWGIVRAPDETLDDPHLHDRGIFTEVEHPELGQRFTYVGRPYIFHKTPWRMRRRAPLVGEDNEAVYLGELGLSKAEMTRLREGGVI